MQLNHQNSTIPDVFRVSENALPNLSEYRNYLAVSQNKKGTFDVHFSHDDDEIASTLLVAAVKHPRLLAMLKSVVVIAEKLKDNPENRKAFQLAHSMREFFKTFKLTKPYEKEKTEKNRIWPAMPGLSRSNDRHKLPN